MRAARVVTASRGPATGAIGGRVVHAFTEAPLVGAVVQVDGVTRGSRSDSSGRFLIRRVEAGTRILRAFSAGYLAVTQPIVVTAGTTSKVALSLAPAGHTHSEHVTVTGALPFGTDRGASSETLERGHLEHAYGSLTDDPIRVVHALPRVTAVDDLRNEFAVRGSPFRHVDIVVDGVSTSWLQHTAYGRGATGSLAMFAGPVLEEATLRAGAYPRRYNDRLGAQLDMTLREGSRTRFMLRGAVGGSNAMAMGEGPLGAAARGSWLVALRKSYVEWPMEPAESTRTPFGFQDGIAKVVYDIGATQQVGLTVLGGAANVDWDDASSPNELGAGSNEAAVANFSWRSTFGDSMVLRQRAYVAGQHFVNKRQSGRESDRGSNGEVAYRADITRPIAGGLLEFGGQIGRTAARNVPPSGGADAFAASSWQRSAYAHFAWAATPTLTVSPGLRITDSALLPLRVASPWILGEWAFGGRWALNASAGASHQLTEIHYVLGKTGSRNLRPERATYLDVGIEQRLTKSIRWQATVFSRNEKDILRAPDIHPRLVDGVVAASVPGRYANVMEGLSRGVEVIVDRRSATGLSGWAAYAYGKTRHTDTERHETFWADFDQRHAFNVLGTYRFSERAGVGAAFGRGPTFRFQPIWPLGTAASSRPITAIRCDCPHMAAWTCVAIAGWSTSAGI